MITCTFCNSEETQLFSEDKKRQYLKCNNCGIIFVPPGFYLSPEEEKERYSKHTNSNSESGYISFLSRIIEPTINNIKPNSKGLDFGCGPGPILKDIFKQKGFSLEEYDLYFKKNDKLLLTNWDFIITTEVVEHMKKPYNELKKIWDLINNNGILSIMTNLYRPDIDFKSWYYKGDLTHIHFFSQETFKWLAGKFNAKLEFIDKDIIILKKDYYINKDEELK